MKKNSIKEDIDSILPYIIGFRRNLHKYPELGMQEQLTTRKIKNALEDNNVEILDYPLKTGAIAIIRGKNKGKTIALRGDIDALPLKEKSGVEYRSVNKGLMHACGHDFHTSIMLGTAMLMNKFRDKLYGNIIFVFQPGEEVLQGAKAICKTGVIEDYNIESILGIHCTPGFNIGEVGIRYGKFLASSSKLMIKVNGRSGHGAHPQNSIDPILIASHIIIGLQELVSRETSPLDSLVISICKISAGQAPNIIPDSVIMEGTVRTISNEMQDKIEDMINRIASNIAEAYRGSAEVNFNRGTIPLICDNDIVEILEKSLETSIGKGNIIKITEPTTGSEDFSEYSKYIKTAYCRIGARGEDERSSHVLHSSSIALDEGVIEKALNVTTNYCFLQLGK